MQGLAVQNTRYKTPNGTRSSPAETPRLALPCMSPLCNSRTSQSHVVVIFNETRYERGGFDQRRSYLLGCRAFKPEILAVDRCQITNIPSNMVELCKVKNLPQADLCKAIAISHRYKLHRIRSSAGLAISTGPIKDDGQSLGENVYDCSHGQKCLGVTIPHGE